MNGEMPAYGLWSLVVINTAVFVVFLLSFAKPRTKTDWRSFGAFSAFLLALFTEMYGFPLTIYLLSGWLSRVAPDVNLLSHDSGHLLSTLMGWKGDAHLNPLHLLSNVLIVGGFILIASAWKVLHAAQQNGELATTGPYARVRHPQYAGFILIMVGFLVQWPTLVTLVMFPILVAMYVRLAKREEREARDAFGVAYDEYSASTPGWIPRHLRQVPNVAAAKERPLGTSAPVEWR